MSATGLQHFDETIHVTNVWLKEIMDELDWAERHKAYRALRTTLHALRDRLPVELGAHLSAQLPLIVRGAFYEGWKPSECGGKDRSAETFLAPVADTFDENPDDDPRAIARAVFAVLRRHVSEGEMDQVHRALPARVRDLLSKPASA